MAETIQSIQTTISILGDLAPIAPLSYDDLGNVRVDPNAPEPNRADTIYDGIVNDLIETGGGDDNVNKVRGRAIARFLVTTTPRATRWRIRKALQTVSVLS